MKNFDVVIVGGGPAGLRCAEILSDSDLKVLLLEKETGFGRKICAGGLTRKDLAILPLPEKLIEHSITDTGLFSPRRGSITKSPEAFVFTVNREEMGTWHRGQIKSSGINILTGAKVTSVSDKRITINGEEQFGYKYLIGADGYNSIVRKYLGVPQEKRLIGIQYQIPKQAGENRFEIHFHSRYFKAWYAWVFPHKDSYTVGCCADPDLMSSKKLKDNFHQWLKKREFDITNAKYESAPISYDYRGIQFGNVFLTGEAGGFASGFTGEGIYQALVSGEAAARFIIDPHYDSQALKEVIRYNRIQHRIMKLLFYAGPFRGVIHELIVLLLQNRWLQMRLNRSFS